jgi:hypothetical protein
MARYKFMTLTSPQAAKQIEKKESGRDRSDFAKIVVLATGKRIGIYGTSSSVNVSTLPSPKK